MERLTVDQRQAAGRQILTCLQEAFCADPSGVAALAINRVPINAELADHPHLGMVAASPAYGFLHPEGTIPRPMLGLVGLLNAMLSPLEIPAICVIYGSVDFSELEAENYDSVVEEIEGDQDGDDVYIDKSPEMPGGTPGDNVYCIGFGNMVDPESKHAQETKALYEEAELLGKDVNDVEPPPLPEVPPWTDAQKRDAFRRMLGLVQSCFESDPAAMYTLLGNRVSTTAALASHPYVMVEPMAVKHKSEGLIPMVGVLGVINGVLGCLGLPLIAAQWEDCDNGYHPKQMVGFQEFKPPQEAAV